MVQEELKEKHALHARGQVKENYLKDKTQTMTEEQASQIDYEKENNVNVLRDLVKFWQAKAFEAEIKYKNEKGPVSEEQINTFPLERQREIIDKNEAKDKKW